MKKMTTLSDDCLLHVFRFLDPITWASIAKVCTRWEGLALIKMNKITEISIKNPRKCSKIPMKNLKVVLVDKNKLRSTLQYIGPYVRSVNLSDFRSKTIIFNCQYSYYIPHIVYRELILTISETCKNIENLQFAEGIDVEQLLISNKNLKKVIFSGADSDFDGIFSSHSFDSVEEVIWNVQGQTPMYFYWFPNVRKLSLFMTHAKLFRAELLMTTLERCKSLKSLSIQINTLFYQSLIVIFNTLSNISTLFQLEELCINEEKYSDLIPKFFNYLYNLQSVDGSLKNLVSSCQNLLSVKFDCIALRLADVNNFFKLPRLEELTIMKASSFVPDCPSENLVNLRMLEITFQLRDDEESPCLCDIVEKMPALRYLKIDGITPKEASDLTCRAIASGVLRDKNVFIKAEAPNDSMIVYKTVNSAFKPEPLKLWIKPQKRDYDNDIHENVKTLKDCLLVKEEFEIVEQENNLFRQYKDTFLCCVNGEEEFTESDTEYENDDWEYYRSESSFDDDEDDWDH